MKTTSVLAVFMLLLVSHSLHSQNIQKQSNKSNRPKVIKDMLNGKKESKKSQSITINRVLPISPVATSINYDSINDVRDGSIYKTVQIGDQIWMAENLNFETPTGSWAYESKSNSSAKYGRLYNWETSVNCCPEGWHLPTDEEWTVLSDFLGGESVAGGKLKEAGMTNWKSPNRGATNESGFTALPVGYRYRNGNFYSFGGNGGWWTATESDSESAWGRVMGYSYVGIFRGNGGKKFGYSVRCLKD